MPKKDAEVAVCDGCSTEQADIAEPNAAGLRYCPDCAERREDDPQIVIQGRTLTFSELKAQAKNDKDLAAALKGDTVQLQVIEQGAATLRGKAAQGESRPSSRDKA